MIRRIIQLSILMVALLVTSRAWATTYYIDWVNGTNANNGTTKSTPWKHAPGMYGCSNNCLTKQTAGVLPGDQIILKGGVTWPNAALGWLWTWSGNATTSRPGCSGSGCIYVGVDQTWYTGGSWSRPKLDAEGSAVATRDTVANALLRIYANYIIIDNIEFTGLYWTDVPAYGSSVNLALPGGTPGIGTNIELKNLYIHGWSHNTYASGTSDHACAVIGDTGIPNNNTNTIIHDSVIDGSDTDRRSCSGIFGSPPYIERNYIRYTSNGIVANGTVSINGNTITNIATSFDPTAHMNGIEINASRDVVISNNVVSNLGTGTLTLWIAPYPGYTATIFNNLFYNTDVNNIIDIAPAVYAAGNCTKGVGVYCNESGTTHLYNNTIECGQDANPNAVCAANISITTTAVTLKNNHFITSATAPNGGAWSLAEGGNTPVTASNNVVQSKATANGQGYTSSQTYPFYPTDRGGATLGAGMDLRSLASGIPSTALSDTSLGVKYDAVNHRVIGPNRTPRLRGTKWDVGAYQGVAPPQNLRIMP